MRALLDINVLIALSDPSHPHHDAAHAWFAAEANHGWASCVLTVNGFVRVISNPNYDLGIRMVDAVRSLESFCAGTNHEYWATGVSLLDETLFRIEYVAGPRQITDVYLLGLAVRNRGRFATFDRTVPLKAVMGATAENLVVIGAPGR